MVRNYVRRDVDTQTEWVSPLQINSQSWCPNSFCPFQYKCKFTRVAIKLIYAVPTVSYGGYIKNFKVGLTQNRVTQSRDFR